MSYDIYFVKIKSHITNFLYGLWVFSKNEDEAKRHSLIILEDMYEFDAKDIEFLEISLDPDQKKRAPTLLN